MGTAHHWAYSEQTLVESGRVRVGNLEAKDVFFTVVKEVSRADGDAISNGTGSKSQKSSHKKLKYR